MTDRPQAGVRVCVPVTANGEVDPRWGRAAQVAVADVVDGEVRDWQLYDVRWDAAHDTGSEGAHHARIVRFLRDHAVDAVGVDHVGAGMQRMLTSMNVRLVTGLSGDARAAALTVAA
jgi:predicted Fe-Mo cluster-binding NifX family protein